MRSALLLCGGALVVAVAASAVPANAAEPQSTSVKSTAAKASAATPPTAATQYTLRYKLHSGEELRTRVSQLATIETTISGSTQSTQMISLSTKLWRVKNVDAAGNITFEHSVETVDMRNEMSGRQEIRYNSQTDKKAPPGYEDVAKSLNTTLAVVTIDPAGTVLSREEKHRPAIDASGSVLVVPLPKQPAAIGCVWTLPNEVTVPLEDGTVKKIETRLRYELEEVKDGIATISVETQILTPVDNPKVRAQLIQRLWSGQIRFDIDAGRMVGQRTDLDERVLSFSGPESAMHYVARFTEELLPSEAKTAALR
ncbi:MAG TPA: hypothetical protein VHX65_14640 [Pirellulales bacterium]|jgi:hypothetical protein|nr:hypothetical protein [Pirellulales bacterium]